MNHDNGKAIADTDNWIKRLISWWADLCVKPYVKVRDLNNGKDTNGENAPKPAAEVGIKITF